MRVSWNQREAGARADMLQEEEIEDLVPHRQLQRGVGEYHQGNVREHRQVGDESEGRVPRLVILHAIRIMKATDFFFSDV